MHRVGMCHIPFEYPLKLFKSWPLIPTIWTEQKSTNGTYLLPLHITFYDGPSDSSVGFIIYMEIIMATPDMFKIFSILLIVKGVGKILSMTSIFHLL